MSISSLRQRAFDQLSRAATVVMNAPVPTTTPRLSAEQRHELDQILEPGDVILQSDDRYPGWQISQRLLFGSDYSHSAFYAGEGNIIDADSGLGVSEHKLDDLLMGHRFSVIRPDYQSEGDRGAALNYAREAIGKPFDGELNTADDSELYCSELVGKALASMPHPINVPARSVLGHEIIIPDAFCQMPEGKVVWSNGGSLAKGLFSHWPVGLAGVAGAFAAATAAGPLAGVGGLLAGGFVAALAGDLADPEIRGYIFDAICQRH